jgi:hypothetical protein
LLFVRTSWNATWRVFNVANGLTLGFKRNQKQKKIPASGECFGSD